jgi:DNA-binding transcriptional regulator YhcF (GntR family)
MVNRARCDDVGNHHPVMMIENHTPSINEIAVHFKLNYKTVYYHVMKLIVEGRLRQERGKLVVVGSEWIEPSGLPVQRRFDF